MGPFHIETVIHLGIPLVAHKDNRPVPGEVPRIQALISRILIQMDDPLIGLKTGNFGIAIQIPDGTVIEMKGDPSVGSDPGIQILVIHLALQLGAAAFQIRLQRTAGSSGQIPVDDPGTACMAYGNGAPACRPGCIGAAIGRQAIVVGIESNRRLTGNGPDFSIHHGMFRSTVADGYRHGIGLYGPHATGRVYHDVPALEVHGMGTVPQCPDAAVNLKQVGSVMAQVYGTTGSEDQVLIFIGPFIDMEGKASYFGGRSDTNSYALGLYDTKVYHDGQYLDLAFRIHRLMNKIVAHDGISGHGDNTGMSLGAEYGWKKELGRGWFVEPQAQFTLGWLSGADWTMENGVHVEEDNIRSAVGRTGLRVGYQGHKAQFFVKADWYHEFDGAGQVHLSDDEGRLVFDEDYGDTWFEYGIGGKIQITPTTQIYADLDRSNGGTYHKNWSYDVGIRWAF